MKDVIPRYKAMRGFHVPRRAGWDTHGLPVEIEVEKELRISGKDAIEAYGVEPFVRRCLDSVFRYTEEWQSFTEKLGFWLDMGDAYVTYHQSYVESVWWALSQLFERGLLYRGHKVVWWWAQGGTVLSAAEVGEGYRTVDDPSIYVRFPLADEPDTSLLVWTTTPWTLPSNSFAAVNADVDYVVVRDGEQRLVVAAALRAALAEKVGRELPVERTLRGAELFGQRYAPPFDGSRPHTMASGACWPRLRRARRGHRRRARSTRVRRVRLRAAARDAPRRLAAAALRGAARRRVRSGVAEPASPGAG
jgi:isoleucyl-tRNA synthetase